MSEGAGGMDDLAAWIGRSREAADVCALPLVRRVAVLLDLDPAGYRDGDPLPHGWHMCLFTPLIRQSALGADGHARHDAFMPPYPLPRRMLGGRRTVFHRPVTIGADVRKRDEIVSIEPKSGRSGRMVLITTRATIFEGDAAEPSIVEEQDSIYREEAGAGDTGGPPKPAAPFPEPAFSRELTTDPTMLFRYSAVAFNTHRIHYDRPYAMEQEGYAGLIVNGGLTALLLVELFRASTGRSPRSMSARNRSALLCGRPVRLCGAPDGDGWLLWAEDRETSRIVLEARIS